jgi:predicted extracellular nuclease
MLRIRALVVALSALVVLPLLAPAAAGQTPGVLPIGAVQGAVPEDADGPASRSPYAPPSGNGAGAETVTVQAVITQQTLDAGSPPESQLQRGLFVQNTLAQADADPNTSDGIFVFIGRFDTLRVEGGGFYTPVIGDEVVLRGRVNEFFNLTQLSNPFVVSVVRGGVDLDTEAPVFDVAPPDDLAEAGRYWERREGMRGAVPAGAVAVDGRDVFGDPETPGVDGEVWVVRGDHPVANRADPYAERAFRDPHPLDNVPDPLFDDGNGYRILLGSLGVKATENDTTALIAPVRTYDTVTNPAVGGLYYAFGKYQIQPAEQLVLQPGVDPAGNAPPQPAVEGEEYAAATFNVENLYDYRDDPFDGCDFAGNAGCPGVSPPFDYVPASEADYQARLTDLAAQVAGDLRAPDLIAVQETEDQDLCTAAEGALTCGTQDNADGRPDTLQELALAIAAQGGPVYDAAYDRDGADDRGISAAWLYRTDRVELLPADPADPVLGAAPAVGYRGTPAPYNSDVANPKALNADLPEDVDRSTGVDGEQVFTRDPQVAHFRVWRTAIGESVFTDVYGVSNHFSSGPDRRVGQRREQAGFNAAIVAALEAADPEVRVLVGGDLNVFPRPDDPFAPGDPLFPSDQLAPLYDAGLENLYERLLAEAPAAAFSYVFQGQTQTLDHLFVTGSLSAEVRAMRAAHVNADWPAEFYVDGPRGVSDHDPQVARLSTSPTIDRLADLVVFYADEGLVAPEAEAILLDRLGRAAAALERGDIRQAQIQLRVFRLLLRLLPTNLVDPAAAATLRAEAALVEL